MPFVSCLLSLARTSITMFNRHGKSGHFCLVPDFPILYDDSYVFFTDAVDQVEKIPFYSYYSESFFFFIMKEGWVSSNSSVLIEMITWVLFCLCFFLLIMVHCINFQVINQPYISGTNPAYPRCKILFTCSNFICQCFVEDFGVHICEKLICSIPYPYLFLELG